MLPAKITAHCATSRMASPAASSERSAVRFMAAIHSPCPTMRPMNPM